MLCMCRISSSNGVLAWRDDTTPEEGYHLCDNGVAAIQHLPYTPHRQANNAESGVMARYIP